MPSGTHRMVRGIKGSSDGNSSKRANLHKCSACNKIYESSSGLRVHMYLHNGKFTCDICEKHCRSSKHLKEHRRTHTGEKPLVCDHCGKGFNHDTSLQRHRQICGEDKVKDPTMYPFGCEHCDRRYKRLGDLNSHRNIHSGKNKCHICEQIFKSCYEKERHLLVVHSGVREYQCQYCQRPFGTKWYCGKHEKNCNMKPATLMLEEQQQVYKESQAIKRKVLELLQNSQPQNEREIEQDSILSQGEEDQLKNVDNQDEYVEIFPSCIEQKELVGNIDQPAMGSVTTCAGGSNGNVESQRNKLLLAENEELRIRLELAMAEIGKLTMENNQLKEKIQLLPYSASENLGADSAKDNDRNLKIKVENGYA